MGRVLLVPGNHDTGNFVSAPQAAPTIEPRYVEQWASRSAPIGSATPPTATGCWACTASCGAAVCRKKRPSWTGCRARSTPPRPRTRPCTCFQHAPLFLHAPDEVRGDRGTYWCPEATARDRVLAVLDRPHVQTLASGHVHRRRDRPMAGGPTRVWWCPALSGTHSDADYFPVNPGADTHGLPSWTLNADGTHFEWIETRQPVRTRQVR